MISLDETLMRQYYTISDKDSWKPFRYILDSYVVEEDIFEYGERGS
ncbi:MAG: hypothetical protein K5929_01335 [Lachnospiraceae bacterium]|nr:hypothetical protein [Lachnospiraceae bacterium]